MCRKEARRKQKLDTDLFSLRRKKPGEISPMGLTFQLESAHQGIVLPLGWEKTVGLRLWTRHVQSKGKKVMKTI